jgi:hypothetical protein
MVTFGAEICADPYNTWHMPFVHVSEGIWGSEEGNLSDIEKELECARVATGEELNAFLYHASTPVLLALLENPAFDEARVTLLLARKDLSEELLQHAKEPAEDLCGQESFAFPSAYAALGWNSAFARSLFDGSSAVRDVVGCFIRA